MEWQALSVTKWEEGTFLHASPHPLTGHRCRTFQPRRILEPRPPTLAAEFREGHRPAEATQPSWVSGDLWPSPGSSDTPPGGQTGRGSVLDVSACTCRPLLL